MKLTKAQKEMLTEAVDKGKVYAVDTYPPVLKLLAFGFIKRAEGTTRSLWVPTDEGRAAIGKP